MRWFVFLLLVTAFLGCGNPDIATTPFSNSGTSAGPAVSPQFRELASTVTQTVGPAGGTLESVLSDGTRFRLTVPAGALAQEVELRMTPVAVSGNLGLPVQMPLAVKITPSGTRFTGGAELAITLPPSLSPQTFHPYIMEDSGTPMGLVPSKVSGQTVTFQIFHLTVPGISPDPVPNPPVVAAAGSVEELTALVVANDSNPTVRDALLRDYARDLAARGNSVAGRSSRSSCDDWLDELAR